MFDVNCKNFKRLMLIVKIRCLMLIVKIRCLMLIVKI